MLQEKQPSLAVLFQEIKKDVREMDGLVRMKISRYGLELHLNGTASFEELADALRNKLTYSRKFFEGTTIAVTFAGRTLSEGEEERLLDLISKTADVQIACVVDRNEAHEKKYRSVIERTMADIRKREGQFYRGDLKRSQILESETSIVIIGNVEEGAKVVSKGNVVVLGRLSGSVYAGAPDTKDAFVAAVEMEPWALKIGSAKAGKRSLALFRESRGVPQVAFCDENSIMLDIL